jgi:MtN3 and saliva related transmembrane protein
MSFTEWIGSAAAILTTVAFFPQVFKVYTDQKTDDLSLVTSIMFTGGVFCWFLYGVMLKELPIIISNAIICLCQLYILTVIVKNEKKNH